MKRRYTCTVPLVESLGAAEQCLAHVCVESLARHFLHLFASFSTLRAYIWACLSTEPDLQDQPMHGIFYDVCQKSLLARNDSAIATEANEIGKKMEHWVIDKEATRNGLDLGLTGAC